MGTLQANHKNKVLSDIDPANLEWLCPSCHKEKDAKTEVGVSIKGDEWGYGLGVEIEVVPDEEEVIGPQENAWGNS